jgi:hypothetical protein
MFPKAAGQKNSLKLKPKKPKKTRKEGLKYFQK